MKGCRSLSDEEINRMLAAMIGDYAARDKALFILGLKTGFRVSELLSLTVGDIYRNGQMMDRVAVARRHMKGGKAGKVSGRSVPLHPEAKAALASWLQVYRERHGALLPSLPLFVSRQRSTDGALQPIGRHTAWAIIVETAERCGILGAVATHSLRKSFAATMYRQLNHDLLKLQHAMGHSNIQSTIAYLSFDQADVDAAILA